MAFPKGIGHPPTLARAFRLRPALHVACSAVHWAATPAAMRNARVSGGTTQRVVVFARAPQLGQVKTRLAATVGAERALEIYTTLAEGVVASLAATAAWELVVRCAPDAARDEVARWFGADVSVEPQGEGDLGARMLRALEAHLAGGAHRVVIVGTDCPDLDAHVVQRAFAALVTHDLVYGPASDGGYYLVGARRPVPAVFTDVPWSAVDTLAVSLERARQADYSVQLLDVLADIDTEQDWLAWEARRAAQEAPNAAQELRGS
jgi:uncharacterized protein